MFNKKSIDGLKQAGRQWHLRLNEVLKKFKLNRSKFDPCVHFNDELTLLIAVYVDDLIFVNLLQKRALVE